MLGRHRQCAAKFDAMRRKAFFKGHVACSRQAFGAAPYLGVGWRQVGVAIDNCRRLTQSGQVEPNGVAAHGAIEDGIFRSKSAFRRVEHETVQHGRPQK